MLAAVHLHPAWSISVALAAAAWIGWYWFRLGRADVPASRRKIRRVSIIIMLISLPMFVRALSFIDPNVDQRQYVMAWMMTMLMVMIVIATACLDALNTLRLHQRQRHDALQEAAQTLARELKQRRSQASDSMHHLSNGHEEHKS